MRTHTRRKQIGACEGDARGNVTLEDVLFLRRSQKSFEARITSGAAGKLANFLLLTLLSSIFVVAAQAQQSSSEDDEDLIKPTRPGVANSAEFQKPGVLQIDYGYDGNFLAKEVRSQQTAPLTVRFAPAERLLFPRI